MEKQETKMKQKLETETENRNAENATSSLLYSHSKIQLLLISVLSLPPVFALLA